MMLKHRIVEKQNIYGDKLYQIQWRFPLLWMIGLNIWIDKRTDDHYADYYSYESIEDACQNLRDLKSSHHKYKVTKVIEC